MTFGTSIENAVELAPALGPWFGLAILVVMLVKGFHPIMQLKHDGNESEAERMAARITSLEERMESHQKAADEERNRLEEKIEKQRRFYEDKIEQMRSRADAMEVINRHKIRNLEQCINAFFWLAEKLPADQMPRIVGDIRKMRSEQQAAEDAEKAALMGRQAKGKKPTLYEGPETAPTVPDAPTAPQDKAPEA